MTWRRLLGLSILSLVACSAGRGDKGTASEKRAAGGPALTAAAPSATGSTATADDDAKSTAAALRSVRSVLLLTVDAFRADQPWTGYTGVRTPYLSALAQRSVVYSRAYSLANLTTASLAGMLSGVYPSELRRDQCAIGHYLLGRGLAPYLVTSGVHTAAAHGHAIFASKLAPSDGFQDWRLIPNAAGMRITQGSVTGGPTAALLIDLLQQQPPDNRFFLWSHFVDPHDAYVAHEGFPPSADPARGLYDGEVAYTDHLIGQVLEALARSPHASTTAVIVTGDHGEAFAEHGNQRHGFTVYDEEVRVPLLLFVPGLPPRRIDLARSTIDLAPTVTELLGLVPLEHWRGRSLLQDLRGPSPEPRLVLVDCPEIEQRSAMRAVIDGPTKTILQSGGARVLDLAADPKELAPKAGSNKDDVVRRAREVVSRLQMVPGNPCMQSAQ